MTVFWDRAVKKMVNLNEAFRVGSSPIWLVSLWEEEIWTQKETPGTHTQRPKAVWRPRERRPPPCQGERPWGRPNLPASWTSSLQDSERINVCCLSVQFCDAFFFSFATFYFVLGYSLSIMLWEFQVDSKGTQPHTYMYPFSPKTPPLQAVILY